jgi:hypothetical protein
LSTSFMYRFKLEGIDPDTGLGVTKFFAVGSDRQLTENEAAAQLGDMIEGEEAVYGVEEYSMSLDAAYVRGDVKESMG